MPIPAATAAPAVTLPELKAHLNLATNTTADDAELTLHLDAATAAIEKRIGPVVTRQATERVIVRDRTACVSTLPLVEVLSLTPVTNGVAGNPVDVTWLDYDDSGVITGIPGTGRHDIVYTAGHGDTASDDHKLAVLYVAEHFWEMQRRGKAGRPGLYGDNQEISPSSEAGADLIYRGFALPRRALELIAGDEIQAIG